MKTLTRTTLASIAVLSVLAACAPARRATNKPAAATNGNQTVPGGLAPFDNTVVVNADAHLPAVPPTDLTVPNAGTVDLTTTTKDQPLIIDLDINGKATVEQAAASTIDSATFNCTAPAAGTTLDKCTDMSLVVSVKGSDNQDHELDILISRRGGLNVDEKVIDPKNPTATSNPDNPNFGTAFYQSTQATDPKATDKSKAIRVLEVAYIKTAKALPTDVAQDTGMITWGTSNKVKFFMQGALVDTAGNTVTCAQTAKNGTCGPDTNVAPIEKNTNNLLKSFIVQMSDKSLKTVVLTVQSRSTTDPTQIVGSTDASTFVSTLKTTTTASGGGNTPAPAPTNGSTPTTAPTAPTTGNPPATTPTTGNTPATMNSMGSVSSGGAQQMSKPVQTTPPPATPTANQPTANPSAANAIPDGISPPPPNA